MAGSPGGRNPQKRVQGRNQNSVAGGIALRLSNFRIRGVAIAVKATRAARCARPGLRFPLRTKIPLQRRRANSEAPSAGCGSFQRTENRRLRRPLDFLLLVIDGTVLGQIDSRGHGGRTLPPFVLACASLGPFGKSPSRVILSSASQYPKLLVDTLARHLVSSPLRFSVSTVMPNRLRADRIL